MPANIASEIFVCGEWNKLPGRVVNMESMNKCKGNLNHYLKDSRGFK